MLNFLHGTWLKHPLHPVLTHLPVSLWPTALAFDLLATAGIIPEVATATAFYAILFGTASALLAVPPGLADWSEVGKDKPAWKIGLWHMMLNVAIATVWIANLVLRWNIDPHMDTVGTVPLVLSIVGTLLLPISVYLGGRMVFDQGTYVGWHEIEKWRQIAIEGGAAVPEEK